MTFLFSIRDDDTCYFTKPEQLENNYSSVWDTCPVGLAIVPFHACTVSGAVPPAYWEGDRIFPVGDNKDIVRFVREKIKEGKVYVMMHGYSHKDEPDGYEFETGRDLERKVAEGKRYLEQVFGVPVRIFVPPHNTLSRSGLMAVTNNGLSICAWVWLRRRPLSLRAVQYKLLRDWWRWIRGGRYPFPMRYPTHTEIGHCSLVPLVSLDNLMESLQHYRKWNGLFCLAMHYWEFCARQKTGEDATTGEVFMKFWSEVSALPDVRFVSLEAVL
ncbi:MAG: DUF2334 domain-containing protein [Candidatus Brocadiales bacterium]